MEENIKEFVVDASFVLAYLLPEKENKFIDDIFKKYIKSEISLISTLLFPFEVLNALRSAIIKRRIDGRTAKKLAKAFEQLEIRLQRIDFDKVFKIALEKNLTVYDASYIVLSLEKKIPLLTLDKKMKTMGIQ